MNVLSYKGLGMEIEKKQKEKSTRQLLVVDGGWGRNMNILPLPSYKR
jgi:hypothetical protein